MIQRFRVSFLASFFLLASLLIVAGCSSSANTNPNNGGGGTATTQTSPTATSAPTTCAQLSGFGSATPFGNIPSSGVPTPAGTIGNTGTLIGGGTGQWYVHTYTLCSPNSDTSLVVNSGGHGSGTMSLFAYLQFINWGGNNHFPADGIAPTSCSSGAHCYLSLDLTQFLSIDQVTDNGNHLITWRVRLAEPPGSPGCSSSYNNPYLDPTGGPAQAGQLPPIPLPPLTRAGQGQGAAGNHYLPLCSAGSAASIEAFIAEAMPAYGWQENNGNPNDWKQTVGSQTWTVEFSGTVAGTPITDPLNWMQDTHNPM